MLKKSSSFLFILLSMYTLSAQPFIPVPLEATVSGIVYAELEGEAVLLPISDATVDLERYTSETTFLMIKSVKTNSIGQYYLDSIESSFYTQYRLTFSADGYKSRQISKYIFLDTTIDVGLTPLSVRISNNKTAHSDFSFSLNGSSVLLSNLTGVSRVTLRAFDLQGAVLGVFFNGSLPAGSHSIGFEGMYNNAVFAGPVMLNLSVNGITKATKLITISR